MRWTIAVCEEIAPGPAERHAFGGVLAEVLGFLFQGFGDGPGERSVLENEVAALAAPHLPVLLHKRARYGSGSTHWRLELESVVDRAVMPYASGGTIFPAIHRRRLIRMLEMHLSEQARHSEQAVTATPVVWRIDTSWAG